MAFKKLLIFVYGTLKREQPNHFWLTEPGNGYSKYLGDGKTIERYPLVIATNYNIPFLLPEPGVGHCVSGEVFEVDNKMLERLDQLEEHPTYYERRLEPIQPEFDSKQFDCWTYFLKDFRKDLLSTPMYSVYDSKGSHGLPYAEKPNRVPGYDYKSPVKNSVDII